MPFRHGRLHPGTQFTPVASKDHPGLHSQTFGLTQRPLLHPLKYGGLQKKNLLLNFHAQKYLVQTGSHLPKVF